MSPSRRDWNAAAIIAAFVLVGLWFSLAVPPFETPDELYHYGYARHIAQGNGLPVIDPAAEEDEATPWAHEGGQAPLYYLLVGALTAGVDQSDFDAIRTINPRANLGDPLFPGNKNFLLYSSVDWPLRGVNLALHVGRWLSLALAAGTLVLVYRLAVLTFPGSTTRPLLALALAASLPQFVFISASLSNDNAVILTSTAAIWWLARMIPEEFRTRRYAEARGSEKIRVLPRISASNLFLLGALLGLAALSKLQGLGVLLLAGLVITWLAWRSRDAQLLGRAALWTGLPVLAIAGWWYIRNLLLYGDPLGASDLLAIEGLRDGTFFSGDFSGELRGLRYSFWGLFGWFNLPLPRAAYRLFDAATLLITSGLFLFLFRKVLGKLKRAEKNETLPRAPAPLLPFPPAPLPPILLLLAAWLLILFTMLTYWLSGAISSQGRLLFPGLAAFGVLAVLGLDAWARWLPPRWRRTAPWALPALLTGCTLFTVAWLIPRAYAAPPPIGDSVAAIPESASPVDLRFGDLSDGGDALELVAIDLPAVDQRFTVGERVPVTLYLRAPHNLNDGGVDDDYQVFVQFLDERGIEVANLTTHPGWGTNPTSLWTPGAVYADTYPVLVQGPLDGEPLETPLLARVYVGFFDPATEETGRLALPVYDAEGTALEAGIAGNVVVTPPDWPGGAPNVAGGNLTKSGIRFGDATVLAGHEIAPATVRAGDSITATLLWEATGQPPVDYTASVQVLSAEGNPVAQFDQMPAPQFPTSLWRAGDQLLSEVGVVLPEGLPPGEYDVWVALYERISDDALPRAPVFEAGELATANEQVRIGRITVR